MAAARLALVRGLPWLRPGTAAALLRALGVGDADARAAEAAPGWDADVARIARGAWAPFCEALPAAADRARRSLAARPVAGALGALLDGGRLDGGAWLLAPRAGAGDALFFRDLAAELLSAKPSRPPSDGAMRGVVALLCRTPLLSQALASAGTALAALDEAPASALSSIWLKAARLARATSGRAARALQALASVQLAADAMRSLSSWPSRLAQHFAGAEASGQAPAIARTLRKQGVARGGAVRWWCDAVAPV